MRFALLGADHVAITLVRAIEASSDHQVVAAYEADEPQASFVRLIAQYRQNDTWESLLHGTVCDAVIVARTERPERDEQLRKLVQAAIPLLVIHPSCESIVGYELEMIRRDTRGILHPYFPGKNHPAIAQLSSLVVAGDAAEIGAAEQVVIERTMSDRSNASVLMQLARDAHVIRGVLGRVSKVSALGGREGDAALANLSVQMMCPGGALARWSVAPAVEQNGATLVLVGQRGKATLQMPAETAAWQLQVPAAPPQFWPDWDDAQEALETFAARVSSAEQSEWLDACRDIEVAETAQRSAKRGRTYELFYEEHKEEDTFKGIMAVGGCAILLLGLLIWIVAGVAEGFFSASRPTPAELPPAGQDAAPEGVSLWHYWPVCPFAIFLLLQLLYLVFRYRGSKSDGDRSTTEKGERGTSVP